MKNNFISILIKLACLLLISTSVSSDSDESAGDALDISLIAEYNSCGDLYEINESEINNLTSILLLSGEAFFVEGDMVMSSTNAKAIVDSYDPISNKLTYYQTAKTGFKSFSLNEKLVGSGAGVSTIEEFVLDFGVPCSDLIVSIEESPEQMMFVFADSEEAIRAKLASQEMMAEIEAEMARQAALEAFQQKIADEKAAAAKSTAAYQSKVANDAKVDALIAELSLEKELAAFEAQLAAELASQEMMAEIEAEMARQAALEAFQQKIADEKAAAAASTAAYQAKNAYDVRVTKIMDDLIVQLDELGIADSYKSVIADELINEATEKLEDEKFIGAISGEIVTVAIHDFCKVNLGLSDSNIELFRKALAGNYLGNVGPQVTHGTEFTSGRWDEYIECVGSKRK
jgi:colicin import membrane protein